MVIEAINGDPDGLTVGIMSNPPLPPFPAGDTLCYPNWTGYSSEFHLCVNVAGALGDLSWLEAGDMPVISYHVPTDPFAPYESAVLVVPTTNDPIVEVQGSKSVAEKANDTGNNDVLGTFPGLADDPYTTKCCSATPSQVWQNRSCIGKCDQVKLSQEIKCEDSKCDAKFCGKNDVENAAKKFKLSVLCIFEQVECTH